MLRSETVLVRLQCSPPLDVIKSMAAEKAVNSQLLIIDRDRKLLRMRMYFGESSNEELSSVGSGMVR